MEQKKTLWIIAAVGAFLLVVLGAAGIIYSPAKNLKPTTQTVVTQPQQTQDSGWTGNSNPSANNVNQTLPPSTNQKVGDMIVLSDNTTVYGGQPTVPTTPVTTPNETTIDLNALKNELQTSTPQPQNINITVNVPENDKQPVGMAQTTTVQNVIPLPENTVQTPVANKIEEPKEDVKDTTKPTKQKVEKATENKPAPAVTKKDPKPVAKPTAEPKKNSTTTSSKAEKKVETKKVNQYWVQVGSYSNKKAAENARSILDANKISSDIFTYEDSKDTLYFRVRVGPYMTESEAEYWKERIIKIPYFTNTDSYITKTTK